MLVYCFQITAIVIGHTTHNINELNPFLPSRLHTSHVRILCAIKATWVALIPLPVASEMQYPVWRTIAMSSPWVSSQLGAPCEIISTLTELYFAFPLFLSSQPMHNTSLPMLFQRALVWSVHIVTMLTGMDHVRVPMKRETWYIYILFSLLNGVHMLFGPSG